MESEAIYRGDLQSAVKHEDRSMLIVAARRGDQEAKQRLILSLLGIICAYAARIQRLSCDFMELASYGNGVLVEKIDEALEHPNPAGYLLKTAWHEMLHHRERDESTIATPTAPGDDPYVIRSLSGLADEDGEYNLPEQAAPIREDKDYAPLYEALDSLPEPGQALICRLYGLRGYGVESLAQICGGNVTTHAYQAAKTRKLYHLKKLRSYLECKYPQFSQQHTAQRVDKRDKTEHIRIPESTLRKLQEAEKALLQRGAKLSMNKLRTASGVQTRYASAYLHRYRSVTERNMR